MVIGGKKISLTTQVFVAMILGSVAGLVVGETMVQLGFIGDIWLNCIKMIVVPMVLCTIVTGITSQDSLASLRRVSARIIVYYVVTTVLACVVGLTVATLLQPGKIANFAGMASQQIKGGVDITFAGFLKGLFSTNMIKTFADGNIVQTLVIAILLGVAILRIKDPERKATMKKCFDGFSSMVFSLIGMVMDVSHGSARRNLLRCLSCPRCLRVRRLPSGLQAPHESFPVHQGERRRVDLHHLHM